MLDSKFLKKKEITTMEQLMENNQLLIKSGINILSALAGIGKTTYMLNILNNIKSKYNIYYFDADNGVTDDKSSINFYEPINIKDLNTALESSGSNEDIIIIDSLKSYCSLFNYDIMSNIDMMNLMLEFRQLVLKYKVTIILIHHSFKEKKLKVPEEHLFGSRAIEEQCDSAFFYNKDKCKIVKNRIGLVRDSIIETPYKI